MAKIVLAWNVHPNESAVTLLMARKLKTALESRGHQVEIFKVPVKETIFNLAAWKNWKNASPKDLHGWEPYFKQHFPDQIVIDLHTTMDSKMVKIDPERQSKKLPRKYQQNPKLLTKPKNWKAEEFRINESRLNQDKSGQLEIYARSQGIYSVEIPAVYKPSPRNLRQKVKANFGSLVSPQSSLIPRIYLYFKKNADRKASETANYLSPMVVRKLAHLIDTTINRDHGVYRQPRRAPNRSRILYRLATKQDFRAKGKSAKSRRKFQRKR